MTRRTRNRSDYPLVHIGNAGATAQIEMPGLEPIEAGRMRYERSAMFGACLTCNAATINADYCESCQAKEQSRIDRWNGRRSER